MIHPADIVDAAPDPFRFYTTLPGDDLNLSPDWPTIDLLSAGAAVARDATEDTLNHLALGLLGSRGTPLPAGFDWFALAYACSLAYARQLRPDGRRPLRMRLVRAVYMLRDRLDAFAPNDMEILAERRFPRGYAWDWIPLADGDAVIDCGNGDNLHCFDSDGGERLGLRLGLPTQIDQLADGRIAIGSTYSDGWHAWNDADGAKSHTRPHPVALLLEHGGERLELGVDGVLRRSGGTVEVTRLPLGAVGRARHIGDLLIAMDWSEAGWMFVLDLGDMTCRRVSSAPVILVNDICRLDDSYYLVDKMQGQVFAFDLDFRYRESRMKFGKGFGRLYDPIAIRAHEGFLHILSWVTGSLVTIRPF